MTGTDDRTRPGPHHPTAHLIVDRDGVLNREAPAGWIIDPADWVWEAGAQAGLGLAAVRNVRLSIVTNQSCVGRALATVDAVDRVHDVVRAACANLGMDPRNGPHFWVCPHAPDAGCRCRKPRPGLVLDAITAAGVAANRTILVGDDRRDLEAGRAAGIPVALVATGKGNSTAAELDPAIEVHSDLQDAVGRWLDTLDDW